MSHDRGCWRCGRYSWEYDDCDRSDCVKKPVPLPMKTHSVIVTEKGAYTQEEWEKTLNMAKAHKPAKEVEEVKYHYSEPQFIKELTEHVRKTNLTHYSGTIQPVDFIMSHASTMDYLVGNVVKYVFRFGKKNGYNKEDLMKAAHYLMMMSHFAEENNKKEGPSNE